MKKNRLIYFLLSRHRPVTGRVVRSILSTWGVCFRTFPALASEPCLAILYNSVLNFLRGQPTVFRFFGLGQEGQGGFGFCGLRGFRGLRFGLELVWPWGRFGLGVDFV